MTVDPAVAPGLLFLLAELVALASVGYVIVQVALRETDHRVALAQGLVVGPSIWGVVVNLVMYALPGMAGAVAGWIFVLALAAVLVWRSPKLVRPRFRTAAIFALATLALFWVALASRQTFGIGDVHLHLGLAASIRAGLFPPELPWSPGTPVPYHYGLDMLNGLLLPPAGPNPAFVQETLEAYAWMSLVLVVITTLLRRASTLSSLIAAPLLIAAGSLPKVVLPAGVIAAGTRASLTDIFWPSVQLLGESSANVIRNIERPSFILSYALAFIVLAHAARPRRRSWPTVITLAAVIGFLGLMSTSVVPIAFVLWAGLEATHILRSRRVGYLRYGDVFRPAMGLALAAILLLVGRFPSLMPSGSASSSLSLGWNELFLGWSLLGTLDQLPGSVALLALGPLAVAGMAVLLARRDRLVLALAAGAVLLVLTPLFLNYAPNPVDLFRLAGHARNFALYALLIALAVRLAALQSVRWRYASGALLVSLVVWPTIAAPVRSLGMAIGSGVELANAEGTPNKRSVLQSLPSDRIVTYIRDHTAVDARVFSPHPHRMTVATGRPNASGYVELVHLLPVGGPGFSDVLNHLDPAAVGRLGFEYIHAHDSWIASLPTEAAGRLNDPHLFELLVHDKSESLYRVLPAFLSLDTPPMPESYEALRQVVPASARVFLLRPEQFDTRPLTTVASALADTRLLGVLDRHLIASLTLWQAEPLGNHVPDFIVAPAGFMPWMFPATSRRPIWWNEESAVYALNGAVDPIMPPPPWAEPFPFSVRVSQVTQADGRIAFTATFDDRAPDQWASQDWVLVATEARPWDIPTQLLPNSTPTIAMWFISYLNPGQGTTSLTHEFDFQAPSLAVRREHGVLKPLDRSEGVLDSSSYVLAVRLRHEYKPNQWRDAAIIPVLRITVSDTGEVSYRVHEDAGG